MLNKTTSTPVLLFLLTTVLVISKPCFAVNANSFVEYTNSLNTATFSSIKTIGLFARGQMTRSEIVYGGLKYSHYELNDGVISSGLYQVVIGASTTGSFAPFLEIGTDILSFLASRDNADCGSGAQCKMNMFIRAGLRIRLPERFTLGLFHESMTFDDSNTTLTGNHNYTGLSIGYSF